MKNSIRTDCPFYSFVVVGKNKEKFTNKIPETSLSSSKDLDRASADLIPLLLGEAEDHNTFASAMHNTLVEDCDRCGWIECQRVDRSNFGGVDAATGDDLRKTSMKKMFLNFLFFVQGLILDILCSKNIPTEQLQQGEFLQLFPMTLVQFLKNQIVLFFLL